jgi:AraC-like DNA-binding protein
MNFYRPKGALAGFYVFQGGSPGVVLREGGELWTPREWPIRWHRNPCWELYYQRKGRSEWAIGRTRFTVPAGGYYLIAPQVRHRVVEFQDEAHFFFAVFDPGRLGRGCGRNWPESHRYGGGAHALETPFRGLMREITLSNRDKERGIRIYLTALCLEVDRLLSGHPPSIESLIEAHPAASRARELLVSQPERPWKLDELAALSGVSIPHLIELFRRDFGRTPRQFLLAYRIEKANELLQSTDRSVTEIAMELGFASSQHFANCFRRHAGRTPSSTRGNSLTPST